MLKIYKLQFQAGIQFASISENGGKMKKISLILGLFLFSFVTVFAAKYDFLPMQITQPNGTKIDCFASGDEFFNYLHDKNGYTIIQSRENGYYYYAEKVGEKIIPSAYRVGNVNPATVGLKKFALISEAEYLERRNAFFPSRNINDRAPNTGILNNLVVYIRFSDQTEFVQPRSYFDAKFNDDSEGAESMFTYYQEVSYQQLFIYSSHYPTCSLDTNLSYQDSHPRDYYCVYNATTNPIGYHNSAEAHDRETELLVNAVNYIAAEVPDTLNIDGDNDGRVDNVCFIIRGGNEAWADLLWAHRSWLYSEIVFINGKRVYDYTFQPVSQNSVITLCHEMFHALGAPDLYHYNSGEVYYSPCGGWDIMDGGSGEMGAYMKYRYGHWIDEIPQISTGGLYSLQPLSNADNNCFRIPSPNSATEYFVVEFRKRIPDTFEMNLPGSGLLIYRIDTTMDGEGNAQGPPDEVYIYRPNGTPNSGGSIDQAYFSLEGGRTEFNDETNPYDFLADGSLGGIFIHQVSSSENEAITFVLNPQQGLVSGTVSGVNPDYDITETEIGIGDDIFHPDENGDFLFTYLEGTYEISASLSGHADDVQTVEIEPYIETQVDFNLEYLEPPTDLTFEIGENNNVTFTWNFADFENENFEYFNIYISLNGGNFNFFDTSAEAEYSRILNPAAEYYFFVNAEYSNGLSDSSNIVFVSLTAAENNFQPAANSFLSVSPNPAYKTVNLKFSLAETSPAVLEIFNLKGEKIRTLLSENLPAGTHEVFWNGNDFSQKPVGSGIYLYRLKTKDSIMTEKALLIR